MSNNRADTMNDPHDEMSSGTAGLRNDWQKTVKLRAQLVQIAPQWEECCGVAPQITNAIAELDAARLVGMAEEKYCADGRKRTGVTRHFDFIHEGRRYEVTGNRPSGKKGSKVSKVGDKLKKDCDFIVWILYDPCYVMEEAWEFATENYKRMFENVAHLRPPHMRLGHRLHPSRDALLARGKPIVIVPREVVKIAKHYRTELAIAGDDPEILLGCIIVSGALDTAEVLKSDIHLTLGLKITDMERTAFNAFCRVWKCPTDAERAAVQGWAERIAIATSRRPRSEGWGSDSARHGLVDLCRDIVNNNGRRRRAFDWPSATRRDFP